MLSFELCRSIAADRERQVERAMRQRRLLEVLAIRPSDLKSGTQPSGDRDGRTGASGSPVLRAAR